MAIDAALGGKIKVSQPDRGFRFGNDALYLAHFSKRHPCGVTLDLGCGSGIVGACLLTWKVASLVHAIEIQAEMAEHARTTAALNSLAMAVTEGDYRDLSSLPRGACSTVVCNPPYRSAAGALLPQDRQKQISQFELTSSLAAVAQAALFALAPKGRLLVIVPTLRAREFRQILGSASLAVQRSWQICNRSLAEPVWELTESVAATEAAVAEFSEPPLIQYAGTEYTAQARAILWDE